MKRALLLILLALVSYGAVVAVMYVYAPRTSDSALASLSEPALSEHFSSSFWMHERDRKSPLWEQALSSCANAEPAKEPRPNCSIIAVVAGSEAQEGLAGEMLAERRAVKAWLQNGANGDIGSGLTGHGAKAGGLPTLKATDP